MAAFEPGELGRALAPGELPAHVAALLPPSGTHAPRRPGPAAKPASPVAAKACTPTPCL